VGGASIGLREWIFRIKLASQLVHVRNAYKYS